MTMTMRGIWRMSETERYEDWFERHHRLSERLLSMPTGTFAKSHPGAPHLDGLCASPEEEQQLGWNEPWNHSSWVLWYWQRLATTGRWWPSQSDEELDAAEGQCPLCFDRCRYQLDFAEGEPDPRIDRAEYVPWEALTDSMRLFLSEKSGVPWAKREGESLLDYTARNFRVTKLAGIDVGESPIAFTVCVSDGDRKRYLVFTLPRDGSSMFTAEGVFDTAMSALVFRIQELGPRGPEELEEEDLRHRLELTVSVD